MADTREDRARRREARKAARLAKAYAPQPRAGYRPPPAPPRRPPPPPPKKKWYRRPLFLPIEDWGPRTIFKFSVAYLVILLALPVIYHNTSLEKEIGDTFAGFIPVGVPLAGALGAVTIGLYGVFEHNKRWDNSYNYWHLTRPFMGALLGSVGYMIFIATIQSTGATPSIKTTPTTTTSTTDPKATTTTEAPLAAVAASPFGQPVATTTTTTTTTPPNPNDDGDTTTQRDLIIYYVIGFIVGYREETFRELVKRAADIIFKPGGSGSARIALLVDKPVGDCPHTVVLTPATAASIVEWKIDYGDGQTDNGSGVPSASSHTYNNPGTYLATVEVTENTGGKSAASAQVTVTGNPVPPSVTAALADPGVQRIAQATTDEDKQKIERELVTNTNKFLEPPFTNPTPTDDDADDA